MVYNYYWLNVSLRYLQVANQSIKNGLRDYWALRHIFTFVIKANKAGNPHGLIIIARDSFYKQQDGHTRYQFIVGQGKVRFFWDYWRWLLRRTPVKWSHFPLLHSVLFFLGVDVYFEHIFIWLFCWWNNFFLEYLEWRLQRLPLLCWRKESATWCVEKFQMQ